MKDTTATTAMGPPPSKHPPPLQSDSPQNPNPNSSPSPSPNPSLSSSMPPPPSKTPLNPHSEPESVPQLPDSDPETTPAVATPEPAASKVDEEEQDKESRQEVVKVGSRSGSVNVNNAPYKIPPWSQPPALPFFVEVLKGGAIVDQFDLSKKGAYMFGRVDLCDFTLDHPTISRFHAVIQFKGSSVVYLYDLGSTHGTFVNKSEVKKLVYVELHVGDVIRFGRSTRLYILQGPAELMPPETELKNVTNRKIQEEISDREASLQRARRQAALADGVSWGMVEDAIEEEEDDADEVTWQTYKGQLTEKQEKTREKVIKRLEKIGHMKKEIDAIRAKDIPQGGLTQGQQTQIARNEQRISQIMEELENLEETLNESIQESLGARSGRKSAGMKRGDEEDEELLSDDDDFYDRTKKPTQKAAEGQSIETADTLLDKKEAIMKEIEGKRKLISEEKNNLESDIKGESEAGDALDAYMSGLSSRLVIDKTEHLEKELSKLQSELDRVVYLLKIADPTGDSARKREQKQQEPKLASPEIQPRAKLSHPSKERKKNNELQKTKKPVTDTSGTVKSDKADKAESINSDPMEATTTPYTVPKAQWLGAVDEVVLKEKKQEALALNDSDEFVDYKDRDKVLGKTERANEDLSIENSAPGLILRKRKVLEATEVVLSGSSEQSTSTDDMLKAEDAVALLLKHTRGYHEIEDVSNEDQQKTDIKKPKRVIGPEKPSFLDGETDQETWVPPKGQSGDGRTALNDRFGY